MFKKIDHIKEMKDKLLFQFKDSFNINVLSTATGKQLNDIEDALCELKDKRGLNEAINYNLDIIGIYKNVLRYGRSDTLYRQAIKNKIVLDNSDGSCESALRAAKIILGASALQYFETYPARCEITAAGADCNKYQYHSIKNAISLAVALRVKFSKSNKPFGFKGNKNFAGYNTGSYASFIGVLND